MGNTPVFEIGKLGSSPSKTTNGWVVQSGTDGGL